MENPLNQSPLAFPVLECIHIVGFICAVGAAALVNFRLLGAGLPGGSLVRHSPLQIWRDALPWTLTGLTLAISSGLLLFSINPDVYYLNYTFLFKMALLTAAILFYFTVIRRAARIGRGRLAASVSLLLWTSVIAGGIFIGLSATRPPAQAAPPAGINFDEFLQHP